MWDSFRTHRIGFRFGETKGGAVKIRLPKPSDVSIHWQLRLGALLSVALLAPVAALSAPILLVNLRSTGYSLSHDLIQFYPMTKFEFIVPMAGLTALILLNPLGGEFATLFKGAAEGGKINQVQFNTSGLARGLYFSKLEFNGKPQLVKKLPIY